jgi:hypothetical protein
MAKTLEINIDQFNGGVSDDPRQIAVNSFRISKHFDIFSDAHKLSPYRSLEADTTTSVSSTDLKQYVAQDFVYASASSKLYALGQTAGGLTKILQKADATTGLWTTPATSEGNGAVKNGCLVEYKDYLWGFQGTTQVFKWGVLSGTPSITNTAGTIGTTLNTISTVSVTAGGTGYSVNDALTLGGGIGGSVTVSTVSAGVITAVTLLDAGRNYTTGVKATNSSVGTGATINVTAVTNTNTTITSVAQGVIAKDDNLYLPYNNVVVRVYPSGTVQDLALKLPTNFKITSISNYGNYLAVACAPISTFNGVSKVFLWNLTSTDVQEAIDWGEGELRILETIEGYLVGVTDRYLNNTTGAGKGSMIIQVYSGGSPQVVKEVFTQALTGKTMPLSKSVKNNRVFFSAKIMTNSTGTEYNEGIWSFGRKNASYPFALTLDVVCEEANTSGIQSFGTAGNYFFILHSNDGSISKTNDTSVFTYTSILESQIVDFGEREADKRLEKIKVSFAKLTAGQSVTAKYKVDGATSWTTIGTANTVGDISHSFLNIETSYVAYASGKEYEVQINSTGGAEILGLRMVATILSNV